MRASAFLFILLFLLPHAVLANEDTYLPPLFYKPPHEMFENDEGGADTDASDHDGAPFLTLIQPEEKEQTKAQAKPQSKMAPLPVRKPMAPKIKKTAKSTVKKPAKPLIAQTDMPAVPIIPVERSTTQLDGQRLANPTARDVLASISGTKPTQSHGDNKFSLIFMAGETVLTLDMKNALLNKFLPNLKATESAIEIHAYASEDGSGENGARRVSLVRALETRDFLIGAGLQSSRINIMPLGNQADSTSPDRVDIVVTKAGK